MQQLLSSSVAGLDRRASLGSPAEAFKLDGRDRLGSMILRDRGFAGDVHLLPAFIEYQRQYYGERGWELKRLAPSLGPELSIASRLAVFRKAGEPSELATYPGQIHSGDDFGPTEMESLHHLVIESRVDRALVMIPQMPPFGHSARVAEALGWSHRGYVCDLRVSLAAPLDEIFANLRKKYRQNIRKFSKSVTIAIDRTSDGVTRLKVLHREVAGRSTRSNETWDLMGSAADSGSGFTVLARMGPNAIVGALYVMRTSTHALAFSAAYRRDLMSDGFPLGHLCEWNAIAYLKKQTSVASYSTLMFDTANKRDDKLLNILRFKEGLGPSHQLVEKLEYRRV